MSQTQVIPRRSPTDICKGCMVMGAGVWSEQMGMFIECACLPENKTCKDCKSYKLCLEEGKIPVGGVGVRACRDRDRMFAEPGKLSYRDRVRQYWELEDEKYAEQQRQKARAYYAEQERKKSVLREQDGFVWTEKLFINTIIAPPFRKDYIPRTDITVVTDESPGIPDFIREIKAEWHALAAKNQHTHSEYKNAFCQFEHEGVTYRIYAPTLRGTPLSYVAGNKELRRICEERGIRKVAICKYEYVPVRYRNDGTYRAIPRCQELYRDKTPEEAALLFLDVITPGWRSLLGKPANPEMFKEFY